MRTIEEKENKAVYFNTIGLVIYIFSGCFGYLLSIANISNEWAIANISLGCIGFCIATVSKLITLKKKIKLNKKKVLFILLIITQFLIDYIMFSYDTLSVINFVYHFIFSAFIVSYEIDIELLLRLLCIASIFVTPFYASINSLAYVSINQSDMGLNYTILNLCLAGLLHFIYFRKKSNFLTKLGYISSTIISIGMMLHGVRGIVLTFVFLSIFIYLNNKNNINRTKLNTRLSFIFAILFVSVIFINPLFDLLYKFFNSNFSEIPAFIIKTRMLLSNGNVLNNRDTIFLNSIELIKKHPITGIGINRFSNLYYMTFLNSVDYPHNFIIQSWIELGIVPTMIMTLVFIKIIYLLIFSKIKKENLYTSLIYFMLLLFPRFLISLNIWSFNEIWITIFYFLSIPRKDLNEKD